jgi:hypothetical protein
MPQFIQNITTNINGVWVTCLGLFTVIALIALGCTLAVTALSSDRTRAEGAKKLVVIVGCCAAFGAASTLITWALSIG